ncbi:MAG: nuclear transport factor 2 family protein [Undibacterium sp.]|nr:nuclear transport factor 2 family protein [Undibacterium sp.]
MNIESADTNQIEAEVRVAFEGLVQASTALDSNRYFDYFDKNKFTGLNADGTVWHSIQALEKIIYAGFPLVDKITSLEFKNVKVTVINPSTAILVNEFTQSILLKSGDTVKQSGGGTQVWVKTNGAWKLVSVSASDARH